MPFCRRRGRAKLIKKNSLKEWSSLAGRSKRKEPKTKTADARNKVWTIVLFTRVDHVNITVPRSAEAAAKHFYSSVLGLEEVPKPESSRGRGGAWYQLGAVQLHLSLEDSVDSHGSRRHVC